MRVIEKLTHLERRLETLAAKRRKVMEPIELRAHVLDDIEGHIEPIGDGRYRLPFTHVRICVAAPNAARRDAFESVFGPGSGFREAVMRRLRDARADTNDDFDVSFKAFGKGDTADPVRIEYLRRAVKRPAPTPAAIGRAHLIITKGTAARKVYVCTEPRINIGRVEEVLDPDHNVVRRNHIVFVDANDAVSETVSRSHAHIRYTSESGQFRVHDDHSSYGTRIFRSGRTIQVPAARGALLRSGDEISFGRAAVRFVVKVDA